MQSTIASADALPPRYPVDPPCNLLCREAAEAPPANKKRPKDTGLYGARLASFLHLESAPTVIAKTRQNHTLAVTRLRSDSALLEKTSSLPREHGFSIQLYLRQASSVRLWYSGRPVTVDPNRQVGSVSIVDLDQEPSAYIGTPFDILQFYIPRTALDEFADENGSRRCDLLSWPFGKVDPVLHSLGLSLLPTLEHPETASDIYTNHLIFALRAHIAHSYGSIITGASVVRGGLAAWQTNRATEMLRANLDGQISLAQVARECRLSVSHFVRAFKQTLGHPPYRWLMEQRIDAAKDLLLTSLPLADIALRCGFADQTCFIRAFRRTVKTTPGDWRRTHTTAPTTFFSTNNAPSKIYA
jgi:AraC family transcriptional regulator